MVREPRLKGTGSGKFGPLFLSLILPHLAAICYIIIELKHSCTFVNLGLQLKVECSIRLRFHFFF